jgi:hypothetical protein
MRFECLNIGINGVAAEVTVFIWHDERLANTPPFPSSRKISLAVWQKVAEIDRESGDAAWTVCSPTCEDETSKGQRWRFRVEFAHDDKEIRYLELNRAARLMRAVLR